MGGGCPLITQIKRRDVHELGELYEFHEFKDYEFFRVRDETEIKRFFPAKYTKDTKRKIEKKRYPRIRRIIRITRI